MFKFKKPTIIILALLVFGGGALVVSSQKERLTVEPEPLAEVQGVQEETTAADLVLVFGEEKIVTYSGVKTTEKTILGLLLQAALGHGFEVDFTPPSGEMGAFVKSIDGVGNTNEKFWQFWLNGEYGQIAMDQQEIEDGDLVEIKFKGFE